MTLGRGSLKRRLQPPGSTPLRELCPTVLGGQGRQLCWEQEPFPPLPLTGWVTLNLTLNPGIGGTRCVADSREDPGTEAGARASSPGAADPSGTPHLGHSTPSSAEHSPKRPCCLCWALPHPGPAALEISGGPSLRGPRVVTSTPDSSPGPGTLRLPVYTSRCPCPAAAAISPVRSGRSHFWHIQPMLPAEGKGRGGFRGVQGI